jgi:hypothetical protein
MGEKTSFWEDAWCTQTTLKTIFRACLRYVSNRKSQLVNWGLRYKRWLDDEQQNQQKNMRNILLTHRLGEGEDKLVWKLNEKNIFIVKSMYKKLA